VRGGKKNSPDRISSGETWGRKTVQTEVLFHTLNGKVERGRKMDAELPENRSIAPYRPEARERSGALLVRGT